MEPKEIIKMLQESLLKTVQGFDLLADALGKDKQERGGVVQETERLVTAMESLPPVEESEPEIELEEFEQVDEEEVVQPDDSLEEEVEDDEEEVEKKIPSKPSKKRGNLNLMEESPGEDDEDDVGGSPGERLCSKIPFKIGPRKNRFKDNMVAHTDDLITFDKKVRTPSSILASKAIEKRPAIAKVKVKCRSCKKVFKIPANQAPQKIASDDSSTYKCHRCIVSNKGHNRDE